MTHQQLHDLVNPLFKLEPNTKPNELVWSDQDYIIKRPLPREKHYTIASCGGILPIDVVKTLINVHLIEWLSNQGDQEVRIYIGTDGQYNPRYEIFLDEEESICGMAYDLTEALVELSLQFIKKK